MLHHTQVVPPDAEGVAGLRAHVIRRHALGPVQELGAATAMVWAREHPDAVAGIVRAKVAFAGSRLSPGVEECYVLQLLVALKELMDGKVAVPSDAELSSLF